MVNSMSPPEDAFTLANLPSDIIRVIVKMEPQSTTSMRLIAPSWYTPLHIIKRLLWRINSNTHSMILSLPSSSLEHFGMEKWRHRLTNINSNSESEFEIDSTLLYSPYHFVHPSITSFFRKCMTIGRLEIDLVLNVVYHEIDQIFATISQFPVQILSFNVNHTVRGCIEAKILNLLRGGSVKKRLVLTADMCNFRNNWMRNGLLSDQTCGPFLFEAVRFVPEVEIVSASRITTAQFNEREAIQTDSHFRHVYWMQVVAALNATGRVRAVLNIDESINQFRITVSASGSGTASLSTLV